MTTAPNDGEKRRAVVYLRVSTTSQVGGGYGLEAQCHQVEHFCRDHSLGLVGLHIDVASGRQTDTSNGRIAAVNASQYGIANMLVVNALDRMRRSMGDRAKSAADAAASPTGSAPLNEFPGQELRVADHHVVARIDLDQGLDSAKSRDAVVLGSSRQGTVTSGQDPRARNIDWQTAAVDSLSRYGNRFGVKP